MFVAGNFLSAAALETGFDCYTNSNVPDNLSNLTDLLYWKKSAYSLRQKVPHFFTVFSGGRFLYLRTTTSPVFRTTGHLGLAPSEKLVYKDSDCRV